MRLCTRFDPAVGQLESQPMLDPGLLGSECFEGSALDLFRELSAMVDTADEIGPAASGSPHAPPFHVTNRGVGRDQAGFGPWGGLPEARRSPARYPLPISPMNSPAVSEFLFDRPE